MAGHAEVDIEAVVIIEGEEDAFGSAVDGGDGAPLEKGDQVDVLRGEDVGAVEGDVGDGLACDSWPERGDDGLDFGEFGHGGRVVAGVSST